MEKEKKTSLNHPTEEDSFLSSRTTRRELLKQAGAVATGIVLASSAKSSVYAVQPPKVLGANERIVIGIIGCGGQGMAHIRTLRDIMNNKEENIAFGGISEIYEVRKGVAQRETGLPANRVFHDYRRLLEQKDIDAVWIATPEHWHARQAIEAMQAGKHIYLEKPMTRYLEEALAVYRVAKQTGAIVQVGSQGCSDAKWHKAAEIVRSGRLGKIVWSQGSYCRNSREGEWNYPIDANASPSNLDWNLWLGPAPKRPFSKERFFRWRKYWDYSAGILSDLFPHRLHPLLLVIGPEFPTRVVCVGGIYVHKDREVADTTHMMADFPSGHTIVIAGCTANEQGLQDMIRGHKATLYFGGRSVEIRPERPYVDEVEGEVIQVEGPGESIAEHQKNFLSCVRTGKKPNCDIELAVRVQVAISMAEIAYRQNKVVRFDPVKMKVIV